MDELAKVTTTTQVAYPTIPKMTIGMTLAPQILTQWWTRAFAAALAAAELRTIWTSPGSHLDYVLLSRFMVISSYAVGKQG